MAEVEGAAPSMFGSKPNAFTGSPNLIITISDPLSEAILDREFVVGNSGKEFILHRLFTL